MNVSFCRTAVLCLFALTATTVSRAWDYEGHWLINQLAVDSLPANFPGFVRTPAARERIGFLGGEADRWRNTPDLELRHGNGPDHFFDLDLLEPYQLDVAKNVHSWHAYHTSGLYSLHRGRCCREPFVSSLKWQVIVS